MAGMAKRIVRALYDYSGGEESALSFRKGDIIQVLTQLESGWWDGLCNGERGWFPSNYVSDLEVLRDAPPNEQPRSGPWIRQIGDSGTVYYYNRDSGITTAETPTALGPVNTDGFFRDSGYMSSPHGIDLPDGWIVFEAETGGPVYYNTLTKETRWSRPPNGHMSDAESTLSPSSSNPMSAGPLSPMSVTSSMGSFTRSNSISVNSVRSGSSLPRPGHQSEGLPPNWGKKMTAEGRIYYYNMLTDETTWNIEDVDMETGTLITKMHRRQASDSSVTSDKSSNASISSQPPITLTGDEGSKWSWNQLMGDIVQAIHLLNHSAKHSHKEKFIPQSSSIVESIRIMLYASGTARKDAPLVASHKNLKMHHRHIMSSLSKLVLSAKLASGVWPPPDAVAKMQQAASEVLMAVRQFVGAAQEAGVEIRPADIAEGTEAAKGAQQPESADRPASYSSDGSIQNSSDTLAQQTNSELIAQLERYTRSIVKMIAGMVTAVRADQCNSSMLITQVKAVVTEVGNFLALVDELPLDSLSEDLTVDFKVNRLTLYNSISGLVMATQTATNPLAPSNAVEQVILSTGLVEKAVKDLLISTKFLIEEKESLEQLTLQNYIEQYGQQRRLSEVSMRPRRAMSMSMLGPVPEGGEVNASSAPENSLLQEPQRPSFGRSMSSSAIPDHQLAPPPPPTSVVPQDIDESLLGTMERRPSKNSSKIQQILGAEAPEKESPRKLPKGKPWFLDYDYDEQDIVFNMEGKVKGGTLEALIERLTLHDSLDPDFTLTFLLTYRSFTDSLTFIDLLRRRFTIKPPPNLNSQEFELWIEKKLTPVRLRVFNIIKNWVETYADDDLTDRQTLSLLKSFAQNTMSQPMQTASQQLIRIIEKREMGGGSARKMILNTNRDTPPSILPRNLTRIKFLELDPTEVARQLTVMESKQYIKIQPSELLKKAWSEKEGGNAANVKAMIVMSNQITGWVASSILMEKDIKKRAQIMKQFILIADRCRFINNFNTLMSILAGLNSAPIHRLKRTWELLSARTHSLLDILRKTMNPTKNFSHYRETLHSANPPCVPFLGFYLTDLTFIEDGNPDTLKGTAGLINFSKRMKTAEVIREIQQYQNAPYVFASVPELQQWLRSSLSARVEDGDLYNVSLEMEPREREDEKIARLLQESGFL